MACLLLIDVDFGLDLTPLRSRFSRHMTIMSGPCINRTAALQQSGRSDEVLPLWVPVYNTILQPSVNECIIEYDGFSIWSISLSMRLIDLRYFRYSANSTWTSLRFFLLSLYLILFLRLFNCFAFSGGGSFIEDYEDGDSEEGDSKEGSPATWEMFEPLGDIKPAFLAFFSLSGATAFCS